MIFVSKRPLTRRNSTDVARWSGIRGYVLHFDILGYLVVCTTLVSLTLMYGVDRTIRRAWPASVPS
jgi:hypothetical protein